MKNLIGKVIDDKYEIKGQLGKGGMGSVYYVEDLKLATIRAMKVISKKSNSRHIDPMTEVEIMKVIQHSYLPTVIDFSEDETNVYIVMEVIQGSNLDKLLKEGNTRVEEHIVINWAKQICSVLQYLHHDCTKKIIYKDIKPSNLIVSQDKERITLIDFGISQISEENEVIDNIPIGTRGYAAPEQFKKEPITESVDIYALGATIYQLLTGINPRSFEGADEFIPLREIDSSLSEGIEYIVAKCLQEDLELRYSTIEEVVHDIENIQKIGQEYENKKKLKKQKIAMYIGGAILSIATSMYGWSNVNGVIEAKYNELIEAGIEARNDYDLDGAKEKFLEAQKYMKNDNTSYYEIAKTYMSNNIDESIQYLNKQLDNKSSRKRDDNFNYLLGKSYFIKGQGYYDEAIKYFEKVDNKNAVDDDYSHLYDICKTLNQYDPNDDSNIENIKEKLKKALNGFEVYIGSNSSDKLVTMNSYITLGSIYQTMPHELIENAVDEQVRILEKAYEMDSSNINLLKSLAVAYREKARDIRNTNVELRDSYLNKAADKYTLMLETTGSRKGAVDIYKEMGDLYFSVSNYEQAEVNYKNIIEYDKNSYVGYMKMAAVRNMQGNINEAEQYLKKAENCVKGPNGDPQYNELKKDLG